MTASPNVHQRLAKVMAEVDYIQKEKKQGMNYTIVSHDAVTAKVRPVLLKHGIVYYPVRCDHTHDGNRAECSLTVRFVNIDEPADFFDVPTFGYGIDPQDKGPGKAMSYAVKYALLKALGLETGDDPDHDNIPHEPKPAPAPPKHKNYDVLVKELRLCTMPEDINRAWKDEQFVTLRKAMPEYWQAALKDQATAIAEQLKAKAEAKDTVEAVRDMFPGSDVKDERITNVEGRELHPMEGF